MSNFYTKNDLFTNTGSGQTWRKLKKEEGAGFAGVAGAAAEVSVGIAELASLWSGAVTARQLSQWGLLESVDNDALLKASAMFAMPEAPFCMDGW